MSLLDDLKKTNSQYKSELKQILEFVNTTEKSLTRKQKRKPKAEFEEKDKEELSKLIDFLRNATSSNDKARKSFSLKSEAVGKLVENYFVPIKHKNFLTEMTLSYLISHQEAMLKDYLYDLLINKRSMLKSGKKITYLEVLNFTSMKSLISHLANKEVDQLGYGSIDDVEKYFSDNIGVSLSGYEEWEKVVEASYRRNLFIHNKGVVNEQYCKRMRCRNDKKKLVVDIGYVTDTVENLIAFNDYCYESLKAKFSVA